MDIGFWSFTIFRTFVEIANFIGIQFLKSSIVGGLCWSDYPNQIHPSGNIDIIISAPKPEIVSKITRRVE
jgi:hypothetical protein